MKRRSPYTTGSSFSRLKSVETRCVSLCCIEAFKKSCLIVGLITVLLTGTLLFSGCAIQALGEAQIAVYEKGEKQVLNPKSPYFEELQAACEEMLTSAESLYNFPEQVKTFPNLEEVKDKDWAVELTYGIPIEVSIMLGAGPTAAFSRPIEISQVLIPVTGKWSQIEAVGVSSFDEGEQNYVCLFLFPEIVYGEDRWEGLIGTKTDVQKIKDILNQFDIKVP